jgi:hypothetical protein
MKDIDSDVSRNNIVAKPNLTSDIDLLFRVQQGQQSGNTPPTFTITVRPTESIRKPIAHLINENVLFRDIVKNLWKLYKYHQEYESFLLGGYSESEFLSIAERYATSFRHITPSALIWASLLLFNVLDDSLTSSDLSVLLNVDPSQVENTLGASQAIDAIPVEQQEAHG